MAIQAPTLFAVRSSESELMDDPACKEATLLATLAHFNLTNRLFARMGTLARMLLLPDMQRDMREYTVIDAGCGGGDGAVRIAAFCRANNIKCTVKGIDTDERTVRYARQRWSADPGVSFEAASLQDLPTDGSAADYIVAANVLHHFADNEVPHVVNHLCSAARRGVLIADLERSAFWYAAFALFSLVMLRGGFSRRDGLLSIRKGFTTNEFIKLGQTLPATCRTTIGRLVPGRIFLFCRKGN
jgi:2-polyprenyl-3-methyl-5-hydroxy-6-metoxy-1,4-benzoquinol methylase